MVRTSAVVAGMLVIGLSVSGCFGGEEGTLQFQVTDQPNAIGDFEELLVTPTSVEVHRGDGGNESDEGEWLSFETDETFDLTQLTDGNVTTLVNASLEAGQYTQIRLIVESAEGTLNDGSEVTVDVPNGMLFVIKPFTIEAGMTTTFTLDINVVKSGGQGGSEASYRLTPVVGSSQATSPR